MRPEYSAGTVTNPQGRDKEVIRWRAVVLGTDLQGT